MKRTFREALSRLVTRVAGSPFVKPVARIALATAGLLLLAFIGRTAVAGALAPSGPTSGPSVHLQEPDASAAVATAPVAGTDGAVATAPAVTRPASEPAESSATLGRVRASPDDPVVLNTATEAEFRRLPGIGPKRAEAILALRARLGRFHAVEDLLKVKGLGRATLKRLRPLVRVD